MMGNQRPALMTGPSSRWAKVHHSHLSENVKGDTCCGSLILSQAPLDRHPTSLPNSGGVLLTECSSPAGAGKRWWAVGKVALFFVAIMGVEWFVTWAIPAVPQHIADLDAQQPYEGFGSGVGARRLLHAAAGGGMAGAEARWQLEAVGEAAAGGGTALSQATSLFTDFI